MWLGLMYRILSNLFKSMTSYGRFQQNSIEVWTEQKRQIKYSVGSFDLRRLVAKARAERRAPECFRMLQNASECFRIIQIASECFRMLQNR